MTYRFSLIGARRAVPLLRDLDGGSSNRSRIGAEVRP